MIARIWADSNSDKKGSKAEKEVHAIREEAAPARAPLPEEPPKPLTKSEQARVDIRQADAGYRDVVTTADAFLDSAQQNRRLDLETLADLQDSVSALYQSTNRSLLFENLHLIRFDSRYYQYHAVNVALLNAIIGNLLWLDEEHTDCLIDIGLVIDMGMLFLPSHILRGEGELTDSDRQAIRQHTQVSMEILRRSGIDDERILKAVYHHHERFNGKGYPDGLAGEDIPLEARITAVADSFDAATARKSYKSNKSTFTVLAEFAANADGALDPKITQTAAYGLAEMLVGRRVILSDRSVGEVVDVRPNNIEYPMVKVLGKRIQTGPELYPVSLSSYVPMF